MEVHMHRSKVDSTFAEEIGFEMDDNNSDIGTLEIKTHPSNNTAGHIYQYYEVSPFTYAGLVTAHSIGAYYNRFIRGKFEEKEVFEQHLTDEVDTVKEVAIAIVDELFSRFQVRV